MSMVYVGTSPLLNKFKDKSVNVILDDKASLVGDTIYEDIAFKLTGSDDIILVPYLSQVVSQNEYYLEAFKNTPLIHLTDDKLYRDSLELLDEKLRIPYGSAALGVRSDLDHNKLYDLTRKRMKQGDLV